jgi:hypothetical protein
MKQGNHRCLHCRRIYIYIYNTICSPLRPPSTPFHDLMNCIVYTCVCVCVCVCRERERERESLLRHLFSSLLSFVITPLPNPPTHPLPVSHPITVSLSSFVFRPFNSDKVLALSISRFQSPKRVCAPCIIYCRSLFVYCTKIVFVVFLIFFFFYISFIFIIIILLYTSFPAVSTLISHTPPTPIPAAAVKSRSSSRFYLFISIFFPLCFLYHKKFNVSLLRVYVCCMCTLRLKGNMKNC